MVTNFSWLIPGRLAGFGVLGTLTRADAQALSREGLGAIVSLTEDRGDDAALQSAGLRYLHLPVMDMHPPSPAHVMEFVEFVDRQQALGSSVGVHCRAGLGRTGTMLACYLVHTGLSWQEALVQVRTQRPGSVETHGQEQAVRAFARSLSATGPRG